MFPNNSLGINEKNHLTIGEMDVCDLADKYGTPLYIMDEAHIRSNFKTYKNALEKWYSNGLVLYASKAFSCLYIYKIAKEEGAGVDVASGGELYTALKANFPADMIYFHGNNKTESELILAIENNVGRIVVDNMEELLSIQSLAAQRGKRASVLFRLKPGIEAHTHEFIMTGQIDSKFGFPLEDEGEVDNLFKTASELSAVKVVGVHCHIGSQIFELEPFARAAEVMMNSIADIRDKYGMELEELNLGGGYGIRYTEADTPLPYDKFIEEVSKVVRRVCKERNLESPKILMEPGRSIVGETGITVYTVGSVKNIKGIRKYVSIDGGMTDNPRYALYDAKYDIFLANKANAPRNETVTISGKCCESSDLISKDVISPEMKKGDYVAVLSTGAYNYSMASNYNRIPRPPVVMIKEQKDFVVVRRESYDDILRNDILY